MNPIATDYVAAVLGRFDNVVENGTGKWRCLCPAHADRNPSLEISLAEDGKLLAKCWTGCAFKAITDAVGLPQSAWFPPRDGYRPHHSNGKPKGRPSQPYPSLQAAIGTLSRAISKKHPGSAFAGSWEYRDATGNVRMVTARWNLPGESGDNAKPKKTFRPIRHDSDGWRTCDPPEPLPLYRLPILLAADRTAVIHVAEGERKADALAALGLIATTSAHGSGGAAKSDWTPLAGHTVCLYPDADTPGEGYTADVADILSGLSKSSRVKIVRLPGLAPGSGEDAIDWIARRREDGKDDDAIRAEIEALAAAAPEVANAEISPPQPETAPPAFPQPVLCSQLTAADPNRAWLLHGYIMDRSTTMLAALWKSGKTTWVAHLLRALGGGG